MHSVILNNILVLWLGRITPWVDLGDQQPSTLSRDFVSLERNGPFKCDRDKDDSRH
jgi:hypothetical protein